MRGRVHEDADVREMTERKPERDVSLLFVERDNAHLRNGKGDQRRTKQKGQKDGALHKLMILEWLRADRDGNGERLLADGWSRCEMDRLFHRAIRDQLSAIRHPP
jgi:hypothetical protein